jgi:signal transduction histidine kinase
MRLNLNTRNLKPHQIKWISSILVGLMVLIIGLAGMAYMVNYLNEQLTSFEVKHNREAASQLITKFEPGFKKDLTDSKSRLSRSIQDYKALGFRTFVVDLSNHSIVFDNGAEQSNPVPIQQSWLAGIGSVFQEISKNKSVLVTDESNHPLLIEFRPLKIGQKDQWVLGTARDQTSLRAFMDDIFLDMNGVIILFYILLTAWGFFAIRSISKLYENYMESELEECTRELDGAYKENLHKSRLEMIGQTASVLAHEMHNPMSSIKLALSGLKGSERLSERELKRVDLVLGEVDRLDNMLSETLDYVRPVKISETPVDLEELFKQIIKQQEPVIKQNNIKLKHKSDQLSKKMCIDKAQFHQVLLNLVKNAIEASPTGGVIKTAFKSKNNNLIFEISNSGKPMNKETLERAFEPFYTTKPKGTGLGLGLVKRVVDEHGGSVEIKSDLQKGTKFSLIFQQA